MNIVRMVGRVKSGLLAWVGIIVGCCVSAGIYAQPDSMSQNWPYTVDDLGIENTKLTPLGALREGSDDGIIPAWTGGLLEFPKGYVSGGPVVDPFEEEKPILKITAQNYAQYREHLTASQIWLFEHHPDTYYMNVYSTHRTFSQPRNIYEGSLYNARNTKALGPRALDASTVKPGMPFPLPKSGWEAMVNHQLLNTGHNIWYTGRIVTFEDGSWVVNGGSIEYSVLPFYLPEEKKSKDPYFKDAYWCFYRDVRNPPRDAGQVLGGCSYLTQMDFEAYLYLPGQRRVRRAPELGTYDTPGTGSDGLMTTDAVNGMYLSGKEEWYDYKIIGRTATYIPYNNYKITKENVSLKDLIGKHHINPEFIRYELHRTVVVEANLLPGYRHVLPRRRLYIDEDSWAAGGTDAYDKNGNLWKLTESFLVFFYDGQFIKSWGETAYDTQIGRYFVGGLPNDWKGEYRWPVPWEDNINWKGFTPAGMRQMGIR